jgi:hypothetical protein
MLVTFGMTSTSRPLVSGRLPVSIPFSNSRTPDSSI